MGDPSYANSHIISAGDSALLRPVRPLKIPLSRETKPLARPFTEMKLLYEPYEEDLVIAAALDS